MILKRKNRYVLAVLFAGTDRTDHSPRANNTIIDQIKELIGTLEFAKANVHIIKEIGDMFVLSCTRGYEEKIILALSFIKKLQNTPISVCTLKTSGTLKAITEYAELVKSKVSEARVSESA